MVDIGNSVNAQAFVRSRSPSVQPTGRSPINDSQSVGAQIGGTQTGTSRPLDLPGRGVGPSVGRDVGLGAFARSGSESSGAPAAFPSVDLSDEAESALDRSEEALAAAKAFNRANLADDARDAFSTFGREVSSRIGAAREAQKALAETLKNLTGDLERRLDALANEASVSGFALSETSFSLRVDQLSLTIQETDEGTSVVFEQFSLSLELRSVSATLIAQNPFDVNLDGFQLAGENGRAPFRGGANDLVASLREQFGTNRLAVNEQLTQVDVLTNRTVFAATLSPTAASGDPTVTLTA